MGLGHQLLMCSSFAQYPSFMANWVANWQKWHQYWPRDGDHPTKHCKTIYSTFWRTAKHHTPKLVNFWRWGTSNRQPSSCWETKWCWNIKFETNIIDQLLCLRHFYLNGFTPVFFYIFWSVFQTSPVSGRMCPSLFDHHQLQVLWLQRTVRAAQWDEDQRLGGLLGKSW